MENYLFENIPQWDGENNKGVSFILIHPYCHFIRL